jgi:endonuclease/exonuclease/phosphatase family metal-dependent hydrolase
MKKTGFYSLLFLFVTTFFVSLLPAQSPAIYQRLYRNSESAEFIKIMSFNTYFLFDTEDDPNVEIDHKFIPKDYEAKLKNVAAVINRNFPDVLGLQEVENLKVLQDLLPHLELPYNILHYDSHDNYTGQDVALLYNTNKLRETREMVNNLEYRKDLIIPGKKPGEPNQLHIVNCRMSKGILETELEIIANKERIVFLVTHLKSQPGGLPSDIQRIGQANTLRMKMEEIFNTYNKKIVLMGDFNDINPSPTLQIVTGESQYVYEFDSADMILYYDMLVDYPVERNYTYDFKKFLRAGGRARYMGNYKTRLDFILTNGWLKNRMRDAYIDSTHDISKKDPSDHWPVCVSYYYTNNQTSLQED